MGFDLKKTIDDIVKKIKGDPQIMDKFQKDPEKTIEGVIGVDIPDGQIDGIINGVKAKLTADKVGGVLGNIGGVFKK